jgi:hypothetical protein
MATPYHTPMPSHTHQLQLWEKQSLTRTPAKLFGERFGMWAILHFLSNDFHEVRVRKDFVTKIPPASF